MRPPSRCRFAAVAGVGPPFPGSGWFGGARGSGPCPCPFSAPATVAPLSPFPPGPPLPPYPSRAPQPGRNSAGFICRRGQGAGGLFRAGAPRPGVALFPRYRYRRCLRARPTLPLADGSQIPPAPAARPPPEGGSPARRRIADKDNLSDKAYNIVTVSSSCPMIR